MNKYEIQKRWNYASGSDDESILKFTGFSVKMRYVKYRRLSGSKKKKKKKTSLIVWITWFI